MFPPHSLYFRPTNSYVQALQQPAPPPPPSQTMPTPDYKLKRLYTFSISDAEFTPIISKIPYAMPLLRFLTESTAYLGLTWAISLLGRTPGHFSAQRYRPPAILSPPRFTSAPSACKRQPYRSSGAMRRFSSSLRLIATGLSPVVTERVAHFCLDSMLIRCCLETASILIIVLMIIIFRRAMSSRCLLGFFEADMAFAQSIYL